MLLLQLRRAVRCEMLRSHPIAEAESCIGVSRADSRQARQAQVGTDLICANTTIKCCFWFIHLRTGLPSLSPILGADPDAIRPRVEDR
jgi:hypothetical protein